METLDCPRVLFNNMTKTKQDKLTEQVLREFRKKDGLKMRLFVDLMIANQGDKKQVREKLDELEGFIHKAYLAGADEMMLEWEKVLDNYYVPCREDGSCDSDPAGNQLIDILRDELIKKREGMK